MKRTVILVGILLSLTQNLFSANLDSLMFSFVDSFRYGSNIIHVKGRLADNYPEELNEIFAGWKNNGLEVKYEDELDYDDMQKNLFFYGPINSYKYLKHFLPQAVKLKGAGFSLGHYLFDDSLDAINLYSSDNKKHFQLSNSLEGLRSLWSTMEVSQYFIMRKYAIAHHGFLKSDRFDSLTHFNVGKLRNEQLAYYSSPHY